MLQLHRTGRGTGIFAAALAFAALPAAFAQTPQAAITLNKPVKAEGALAAQAQAARVSTAMRLAPDYRAFQQAKVGESSAPEVFSFTFNVPTQVTGITGTPDFKVSGGTCGEGRHYLAGDTCTVEVQFTPQGPGHRTGKLAIAHTASAKPFLVPAGGEAIGAAMSFIPTSIKWVGTGGYYPSTLATDGGDNLYFFDYGSGRVSYASADGTQYTVAGGGSYFQPDYTGYAIDASLDEVAGLAVDFAGNVYISDMYAQVVRVVTLDGQISTQVGNGGNKHDPCSVQVPCSGKDTAISYPGGIAVDPAGNLFTIFDYSVGNSNLAEDMPSKTGEDFFYLAAPKYLEENDAVTLPLAVDRNDVLVYPYHPGSNQLGCFILGQNSAFSTGATDGAKTWIVAGTRICGSSGDEGPATGAKIGFAIGGLASDAAGNLYFADTYNGRVRRIDALTGIIHTVAGTGTGSYSNAGVATNSTLINPLGMAIDSQGDVYVTSEWETGYNIRTIEEIGGAGMLMFDPRLLASPSPAQTILVSDVGNSVMKVMHMAFTSNDGGDFAIDPNTTTCDFPATSLQSGETCRIGIIFTPSVLGPRNAVINLIDNTTAGTHQIQLSGTGATPAKAVLSPSTLDFGPVEMSSVAPTQRLVLSNTGGLPLTFSLGSFGADFIMNNECSGNTVAGGGSCNIDFEFAPKSLGMKSAMFTISTSAGDVSATLTGTGATAAKGVLTPDPVAFPTTAIGATSAALAIVLTNTGGVPLGIFTHTVDNDQAGSNAFVPTADDCHTSLTGGGSACTYWITFSPAEAKAYSGKFTVRTSEGDLSVTLTGTGATAAKADLSPATLAFPTTAVGQRSAIQGLTLTNTGGMPLDFTGYSVSGSGSDSFQAAQAPTGAGCGTGTPIAAGASCGIGYVFKPSAAGSYSVPLVVHTSAGDVSATLSGTGATAAKAVLAPTAVTFPTTQIGVSSANQTLTLSNTGGMPLTIQGWGLTGANTANFFQAGASTCIGKNPLEAGSSCTLIYAFHPTATGAAAAMLTVQTTGGVVESPLSGTGATAPKASFTNNTLNFPSTVIGTTSSAQSLTLNNNGGMPFTIIGWNVSGGDAGSFTQTATTCSPTTAMAAGASCTISFTFKPQSAGTLTTTITLDTDLGGSVSGILTGTGATQPPPTFSPTSLSFGPIAVGAKSAAQTLAMTNPGTAALTIQSATANGANSPSFTFTTTCGATLAAGTKCNYLVSYSPSMAGTHTAMLAVATSAGLATASLTGATTATAALTPPSIDFGSIGTGSTSAAQTATLTNAGGAALTITTAGKLGGTNATAFGLTTTCGSSVAAGSNCTYSVTFKPTSVNSFSATLTVATAASTVSTSLTGKGITPPKFVPKRILPIRRAPVEVHINQSE